MLTRFRACFIDCSKVLTPTTETETRAKVKRVSLGIGRRTPWDGALARSRDDRATPVPAPEDTAACGDAAYSAEIMPDNV